MARTKRRNHMKSVSWISTYLDRARIMIYIKKWDHILSRTERRRALTLRYGLRMQSLSRWLVILITGIGTRIRWCGKIRLEFIPALFRG